VINNEYYELKIIMMICSPNDMMEYDDDDEEKKEDDYSNNKDHKERLRHIFQGKDHLFEFQFQLKFKKIPTGPLFVSYEIENPGKIGTWTKSMVGVLMALMRKLSPSFYFTWGDEKATKTNVDGTYENASVVCPLESRMGHIHVTKPGEQPPTLGVELHDTDKTVTRRRKIGLGAIDWNLQDIYTMYTWNNNVNWIQWEAQNLPGFVKSFSLNQLTAKQPIYFSIYEYSNMTNEEYKKQKPKHFRKHLNVLTRLELSNLEQTDGGLIRKTF